MRLFATAFLIVSIVGSTEQVYHPKRGLPSLIKDVSTGRCLAFQVCPASPGVEMVKQSGNIYSSCSSSSSSSSGSWTDKCHADANGKQVCDYMVSLKMRTNPTRFCMGLDNDGRVKPGLSGVYATTKFDTEAELHVVSSDDGDCSKILEKSMCDEVTEFIYLRIGFTFDEKVEFSKVLSLSEKFGSLLPVSVSAVAQIRTLSPKEYELVLMLPAFNKTGAAESIVGNVVEGRSIFDPKATIKSAKWDESFKPSFIDGAVGGLAAGWIALIVIACICVVGAGGFVGFRYYQKRRQYQPVPAA
jgi:hypothetical protein